MVEPLLNKYLIANQFLEGMQCHLFHFSDWSHLSRDKQNYIFLLWWDCTVTRSNTWKISRERVIKYRNKMVHFSLRLCTSGKSGTGRWLNVLLRWHSFLADKSKVPPQKPLSSLLRSCRHVRCDSSPGKLTTGVSGLEIEEPRISWGARVWCSGKRIKASVPLSLYSIIKTLTSKSRHESFPLQQPLCHRCYTNRAAGEKSPPLNTLCTLSVSLTVVCPVSPTELLLLFCCCFFFVFLAYCITHKE